MDYLRQRALLQDSQLVHARWYEQGYPDVEQTGLHPIDHYLRIGAALGRNPSSRFDTRFYLRMNPSAAASPLNPLVHYMLHGRAQGLLCLPEGAGGPVDGGGMGQPADRARVRVARRVLWELGLAETALAELQRLASKSDDAPARAMAARELGLWALRGETAEGASAALVWLDRARADAPDLQFRSQLTVAELVAHHQADQKDAGLAAYERAALAGEACADVMLARATLEPDPAARLDWINTVLAGFGLPGLDLLPEGVGASPYDRLTCASPPPPVTDGPLISVLIAAWQAEAVLPTALRALAEQSWRNLEILVLDDASPGSGTTRVAQDWAERDPRIRLIRMERNGGAYVARNHGLAQARGDFVTLHDADDWAHPLRIETQMRHLMANPGILGNLSRQARMRDDLRFTRWTGTGQFLLPNTSSFLFRRAPVQRDFGGWDRVRISADTELIRRIRHVHGRDAVTELAGGPLAFQRDSGDSAVNDPELGINGLHFGARRAYAEGQAHHRARGGDLHYGRTARPFAVPAILRHDRPPRDRARTLPVVMGGDWRCMDSGLASDLDAIGWHRAAGVGLGLVELYRHLPGAQSLRSAMAGPVLDLVDGKTVQQLVYGEWVACQLLILRDPACLLHPQRYLPRLEAGAVRVILDRPPEAGDQGGDWAGLLARTAENLRAWLGPETLARTIWQPADPLIRRSVVTQAGPAPAGIALAEDDWPDLLADPIPATARPARSPGERLRVGRHMPDPWPDSGSVSGTDPLADLRGFDGAAEVHILANGTLPGLWSAPQPPGWTLHETGALPLADFLAGLDVWLALNDPLSGPFQPRSRHILQAMAAGVPVILSEGWQPLFGPAASYASPATALARARALLSDPAAWQAQVTAARAHLRRHHGGTTHEARLKAAGLDPTGSA